MSIVSKMESQVESGDQGTKQVTPRIAATAILHDTVENENGEHLGSILNLMINVHSGRIEYAVIQFGSFLGLGGKLFAIPFRQLHLSEDRGVFILNRPRADFENMPGFDKNHWPDTNSHYIININALWNTATAVQF